MVYSCCFKINKPYENQLEPFEDQLKPLEDQLKSIFEKNSESIIDGWNI